MIGGNHDLLGFETKLVCNNLHRVNGSAVDTGLAGLAQTPVANRRSEAFKQALEGSRSTIHIGRLDHFGDEEPSQFPPAGSRADRKTHAAGEMRSITRRLW